jgi:hypothetical protein
VAVGSVERGVRKSLRKLDPEARTGGLAALALNLAAKIDAGPDSKDLAPLSRALHATLVDLAKLAPSETEKGDAVDDLQRRREARRSAG